MKGALRVAKTAGKPRPLVGGTPTPTPGPALFLAAARKFVDLQANRRTVTVQTDNELTIDVYTTASKINGRALNSGGLIPNTSVPNGMSGPLEPNSKWIVTKAPANQTAANLTWAPGSSKLYRATGLTHEFKFGPNSGKLCNFRWTTDGISWKQYSDVPLALTETCWVKLNFSTAAARWVEVIGEQEIFQTYGFNFDDSTSAPSAFVDPAIPAVVMLGDSYVFCQGSGSAAGLNQQATKGMVRKFAEKGGFLQIKNHGFRTNGIANDQNGVQSKFKDRIQLPAPADIALSEGRTWGAQDAYVVPSSINDQGKTGTLYDDAVAMWQRLRAEQPTALIYHPIGMEAPEIGGASDAPWSTIQVSAFNAVFGATPAERLANGARLHDRSRAGGNPIVPAGAVGSSPYYPGGGGDALHPNDAGHDAWAQAMWDGFIGLCNDYVATFGGGADPTPYRITATGDRRMTNTGNFRRTI